MAIKKYISVFLCGLLVLLMFSACTNPAAPAVTDVAGTTSAEQASLNGVTGEPSSVEDASAVSEAASEDTSDTSELTSTTAAGVSVIDEGISQATNTTKSSGKKSSSKSKKEPATEPEKTYINIVLLKNRKAKCSSPNVSLATGEVLIEKAGDYRITQDTGKDAWHGQIIVRLKNTEKAELRFENVNIQNNTKNIIQLIDKSIKTNRSFLETESATAEDEIQEIADNDSAPNIDLSFPEGTKSYFSTSANSVTGVVYNESKLEIKGHGNVTFESIKNANNCICSTKSITVKNVSVNLVTAQHNNTSSMASNTGAARGIYSYNKVNLESGSISIQSNGDGIRCDKFFAYGGTANITSSACDGIDADDCIVISGGTITSTALEKSSFKVRRINNTENGAAKGRVRDGNDTFAIHGGIVKGESKRITTVQTASKQPSITCKIVKPGRGTDAAATESKVPAIITIKELKKSSTNKCTKFLYSSSAVVKGKKYTATANKKSATSQWKGTVAIIDIESETNR